MGPLVVAAVVYRPRSAAKGALDHGDPSFDALRKLVKVGSCQVMVDDSKKVFSGGDSLDKLHALVSIAHHATGLQQADVVTQLRSWLSTEDIHSIETTPWMSNLFDRHEWPNELTSDWVSIEDCQSALTQWLRCDWNLLGVAARLITEASFNRFCGPRCGSVRQGNKSDLLSETSLRLVADQLQTHGLDQLQSGQIFFDRHGGRQYYLGVVSHTFPDAKIDIVSETPSQSIYQVDLPTGCRLTLRFTVKGDRFVPVALASIHAKYLREISMGFVNRYFQDLANKHCPSMTYRPTAGYPSDADRFLREMNAVIEKESIDTSLLVRCR